MPRTSLGQSRTRCLRRSVSWRTVFFESTDQLTIGHLINVDSMIGDHIKSARSSKQSSAPKSDHYFNQSSDLSCETIKRANKKVRRAKTKFGQLKINLLGCIIYYTATVCVAFFLFTYMCLFTFFSTVFESKRKTTNGIFGALLAVFRCQKSSQAKERISRVTII